MLFGHELDAFSLAVGGGMMWITSIAAENYRQRRRLQATRKAQDRF